MRLKIKKINTFSTAVWLSEAQSQCPTVVSQRVSLAWEQKQLSRLLTKKREPQHAVIPKKKSGRKRPQTATFQILHFTSSAFILYALAGSFFQQPLVSRLALIMSAVCYSLVPVTCASALKAIGGFQRKIASVITSKHYISASRVAVYKVTPVNPLFISVSNIRLFSREQLLSLNLETNEQSLSTLGARIAC